METLEQKLAEVRLRIAQAAESVRRDPAGITLLAVTKVFPAQVIRDAYALGLREFGENYVQEFEGKLPEIRDLTGARFHLIGHLQTNKSSRAAELFQSIQTVDSAKLARRLNDTGKALDVMLEVKLSPPTGKMQITFGECALEVGEPATREAAVAAATTNANPGE